MSNYACDRQDCIYHTIPDVANGYGKITCHYSLLTGHSRLCGVGTECDKYTTDRSNVKEKRWVDYLGLIHRLR